MSNHEEEMYRYLRNPNEQSLFNSPNVLFYHCIPAHVNSKIYLFPSALSKR